MIVNQAALNGIYLGFNTQFNKVFQETKPIFESVATIVPSTTREQNYKWMGKMPQMKEWIGEREVQNLSAYDYTIKNKNFESTISVDKDDIEDDNLGLYAPSVSNLAEKAAKNPDRLVFGLMNKGFTERCYDKQPFYSTKHPAGGKNKTEISNKLTKQLSIESYILARSMMMSFVDEEGESLELVPDLLVVPPALEGLARKILLSEFIDGSTNVYKDTAKLLVVPALAGKPTQWHLLCTTNIIKPFIYQERKAPKFVALTAENDTNVFMNNKYFYGVDSRGNTGYSFWQMAVGSTGEEA